MNYWRQLICGLVCFYYISIQGQVMGQNTQSPPPDKPGIQVFLIASSKDGSPATPVQSELSVSVDKQLGQINSLRSVKSDNLLFAVLVDVSGSEAANAKSVTSAAAQLFQGLLTDGNQGYLVLFSDIVAITRAPIQVPQLDRDLNRVKFAGGTAAYDAIEQVCRGALSRSRNPDRPRRVVVLISDGDDNASRIRHEEAETAAEEEGVAVFCLSPLNHSSHRGEQFLKEVSHSSGGRAIIGKNSMEGVAQLLSAIGEQWTLSFTPVQTPDSRLHSLSVKSSQKGVNISAPAHIFLQ
jgi:Mg-chelatase subunit ChlD